MLCNCFVCNLLFMKILDAPFCLLKKQLGTVKHVEDFTLSGDDVSLCTVTLASVIWDFEITEYLNLFREIASHVTLECTICFFYICFMFLISIFVKNSFFFILVCCVTKKSIFPIQCRQFAILVQQKWLYLISKRSFTNFTCFGTYLNSISSL